MRYLCLVVSIVVVMSANLCFAEVSSLDKAKIAYSDASINLELAQGRYNQAKQILITELQKPVEVKGE